MKKLNLLLSVAIMLNMVLCESEIEMKVMGELTMLEDMVYFPINFYLSNLEILFENSILNATERQIDASEIINLHATNLLENVATISEIFQDNGIDVNPCREGITESVDDVATEQLKNVKDTIIKAVSQGQKNIADTEAVFSVVRNRTIEISIVVHNCLGLEDDEECLLDALEVILVKKATLPKVIQAAGNQHQSQLELLEENVVTDLQEIIDTAVGQFVTISDNFLTCVISPPI